MSSIGLSAHAMRKSPVSAAVSHLEMQILVEAMTRDITALSGRHLTSDSTKTTAMHSEKSATATDQVGLLTTVSASYRESELKVWNALKPFNHRPITPSKT